MGYRPPGPPITLLPNPRAKATQREGTRLPATQSTLLPNFRAEATWREGTLLPVTQLPNFPMTQFLGDPILSPLPSSPMTQSSLPYPILE